LKKNYPKAQGVLTQQSTCFGTECFSIFGIIVFSARLSIERKGGVATSSSHLRELSPFPHGGLWIVDSEL
jgi:hypothetical protein